MTPAQFWYSIRLELSREKGRPAYGRLLREAVKLLLPWRAGARVHEVPATTLWFVIITENHLQHFRPVAAVLDRKKVPYSILFTDDTLYQEHSAAWSQTSFPVMGFVTRWMYLKAVIFQALLCIRHLLDAPRKQAVLIRFAKPVYLIHSVLRQLLSGRSNKVVLFKAESYQANAVLLASRELGLRSFAIQHGLIGDSDQVTNLSVDTYLVWSDFFKKRLEHWQAGCSVVVTGNAAYDAVFQQVKLNNTYLLPDSPFRITVLPNSGLSHTPLDQVILLLDTALEFARLHPEAIITIKPHPADSRENVRQYLLPRLVEHPNVVVLDRTAAIPFDNTHVVAINNSGAGMEACIWGRPLVVLAPDWEAVQVKQYVSEGVAIFADNSDSFFKAVEEIRSNYEHYQKNCAALVDSQLAYHGQAAEKIVEALTC